jgi:glyoxylase-like metal-dependent hydrolase (beta-lactamase superfamily II)
MTLRILVSVLIELAAFAWVPSTLAQEAQRTPVRSIVNLASDLYRVQNNDHYTVFLVTPDGIILADPINVDVALWLKSQLTERLPNRPVKYVLYSHHHQDHASGAAVFNDTAELIGHANFNASLKTSASANETAAKRYAGVVPVESSYTDRRTVTLGGKSVHLIHPGRMPHASDMTVLHFPAERAVFAVDFVAVTMVPGSMTMASGGPVSEYVDAIKVIETLDFDIAAPGHGPSGKKADIVAHRQYYENIVSRVSAGIAAGRSLEQIQAAKIMDDYKTWIEYDEDNDVNIANVYMILTAEIR